MLEVMTLENRLEQILKQKGIGKGELADKIGVHRNTIRNIINGKIPHLDVAYKIAKVLGKTIYDIWILE